MATVLPGLGVKAPLEFADRSALVVGLVAALAHVARGRPLLIAIDDLPWLDDTSTEVLAAVASAFAAVPILLDEAISVDWGVNRTEGRVIDIVDPAGRVTAVNSVRRCA